MAELKTKPTDASVESFLNDITDAQKRQDAFAISALMQTVTGAAPTMWGSSIIGFGDSHYQYASGRENDWFRIGFSPRKQNFALYLTGALGQADLLPALGKYKTGKGCLYINKLADVNLDTLRELMRRSVAQTDQIQEGDDDE
ncbi:MAG: DUF1801 domain-containing protein [Caldilineaceae bacterium]